MALPTIVEATRRAAPFAAPQAAAFADVALWVSAMREPRVAAVALDDPSRILTEIALPGIAWGIAVHGGALVATCGIGDDDDRVLFRVDAEGIAHRLFACPEFTGSFLASDGEGLLLGQFYNRRVLRLADDGTIVYVYALPRMTCGIAHDPMSGDDALYAVTMDDEGSDDYTLLRLDLATGATADIARIPFAARGLAKRGATFVTNHRERDEIVTFAISG